MKKTIIIYLFLMLTCTNFVNKSYGRELNEGDVTIYKELKEGSIDIIGSMSFYHDAAGGGYEINTDKGEEIFLGYFPLPDVLDYCYDKYSDQKVRIQGKIYIIKEKGESGDFVEDIKFDESIKCTPVK